MIALIKALAAGNALRIFMQPEPGATRWRLLRKATDSFSGQDDPSALVVYDGAEDYNVIDEGSALVNGTAVYYRLYSLVGASWIASLTVPGTPAATAEGVGCDVLSMVRSRLELWLAVELSNGVLKHEDGHIPVLTAPPIFESTRWPVVTVHLNSDGSDGRGIGEMLSPDEFNVDEDTWEEVEGWLARVQLTIVGWSLNPDERIALRQAIKRGIQANLQIFADAGMLLPDFQQSDIEDFERYPAPVYQTLGNLNCMAPSGVRMKDAAPISNVVTTITV